MLPIVALGIFVAKVAGLAVVLTRVSIISLDSSTWGGVVPNSVIGFLSFVLSITTLATWEALIYPKYFSPLRHLPTVSSGYDARLVVESPRGKTTLKWMKQLPDANLILALGKGGQAVVYPVAPDALKDLLYTNAYDFEKPSGLRGYLKRIIGSSLITSEGSTHVRFRKTLSPCFNIKYIRALYPTMWQKASLFLDRIADEIATKDSIEVTQWSSRYALDAIGSAALSHEFNGLDSTDHHPVAQAFSTILEPHFFLVKYLISMLVFSPTVMNWLPSRANRVMTKENNIIRAAAEKILDTKRASLEKRTVEEKKTKREANILGTILTDMDLPRHEILDHMLTLMAAGHDTTASSISWATHLLTLPENWHYQDRIREEVRNALPGRDAGDGRVRMDTEISEATLVAAVENLPFLHGLCEETLRLFPPVPATLREAVRDTNITGTRIPKGTMCVVMMYAINRNPRFWGEDADHMKPERWIDTLPNGTLRGNKHGGVESNYCVETFLHGPRACIGKYFARAELKLAIAAIYGRYEVRRLEGDDGFVKPKGAVTVKPKNGLHVRLREIPGW